MGLITSETRISKPGMNQAVLDQFQKDRRRLAELRPRVTNKVQRVEHPGRDIGKPHGVYVTDLGERRQSIVLCRACKHKFDPLRYQYYVDKRFAYCQGRCDACKEFEPQAQLFIAEEYLTGPNGYPTHHGHSWVPK